MTFKKGLLIMLFVVWIISGVLWYAAENVETVDYRPQRRPALELNAIADNLLNSIK
jgi:hypothetical protein